MPTGSRVLCVGVCITLALCPVRLAAEKTVQQSLERIEVLLTTDTALPESARVSMMDEADAIWRPHGIVIEWLPPTAARPVASRCLRVLIVQKRLAVDPALEPVAIGELVRPSNDHPVALISIEAAKHLVSSVPGRVGDELAAVDERRLGKVLGRTLAHEIGHYLLDTRTHARSGLMRPHFDAFEFTDLRDGAFALDRAAAAWLRTRDVEKFAYSRR